MTAPASHTGLAVAVPEADELLRGLIARFEPDFDLSHPQDMQAHVTALSPFVPPERCDRTVLAQIARVCARLEAFEFRLVDVREFAGDVVYVAVEPSERFVAVTHALVEAFPGYLPYGGRYATVVPHLTVGPIRSPHMTAELIAAAQAVVPLQATARELRLLHRQPRRLQTLAVFPLAQGA